MWDTFFLAALVGFLFLYAPGYAVLRAFRLSRIIAAVCAPLVTVVAYSLLAAAYEKIGVSCSWETLVFPLLGFGVALFVILRLAVRVREIPFGADPAGSHAVSTRDRLREALFPCLYAAVGIIVTSCIFIGTFDDACSFVQEFDNVHHLNTVRAFIDSGIWSSLTSTLYPENVTAFQPPFSGSAFYPSAWHCIASLIVDALGVPVALDANAANFLFCALVFPLNLYLFMKRLFFGKQGVLFFGAFVSLAFVVFPWKLLAWGPLFPNLAAFSLLPSILFCFVTIFTLGIDRRLRIASACLFAVGLVGLAFTQPNAVFSAGVLLVPFCVDRIVCCCRRIAQRSGSGWAVRCALLLGLFVVGVAALWFALFNASFMSGVVAYSWPSFASVPQAIANVLLLSSQETVAQAVLGAFVATGFVYALTVREYRWIAVSYALASVLYVVTASFDGPVKQLLTGFWYTDAMRLMANMTIVAVPLASAGLYVVATAIARGLKKAFGTSRARRAASCAVACIVAAAFVGVNFYPGYTQPGQQGPTSAFSSSNNFLNVAYSLSGPKMYGIEEIAFVEKVKSAVEPGALILNEPNDGSVFAYGANNANVYYRYVSGWDGPSESEESKVIRRSLDVVALDPNVADAVRAIGAEYLLQLDQNGKHDGNHFLFSYEANDWFGIDRIDDDTPGFEIVLSEGDMRLYRIHPLSE